MALQTVFYARFHPERGPSVVHQYPDDSIIATAPPADPARPPRVRWNEISPNVIPPYELCDRPLSIVSNGHRVLGFPISLEDAKYERNRFTFNVCFVLDERQDARPWYRVVAKTASFFRALEEEGGLLQAEERLPGLRWAGDVDYPAVATGVLHALLKGIVDDMNTYEETCIPVPATHDILNLRLAPPRRPPPPKVRSWDVPLLVEVRLVKRAVRELVYHERAILLDLFHFQAIYTPTTDLAWFVRDEEMLEECGAYVALPPPVPPPLHPDPADAVAVSPASLVALYTSLSPGLTVQDFALTHEDELAGVDVRRLITYGVVKGVLRRVHKYALALDNSLSTRLSSTQDSSPTKSKPKSNEDAVREFDRAWKRAALTSGWATPPSAPLVMEVGVAGAGRRRDAGNEEENDYHDTVVLRRLLDGRHCFDEICVTLGLSEKRVVEKLRGGDFGEVILFNK
ncbi:Nitrogen permease regulator 2 [Teratosphaeriaceae sp. CCFEE 6253]|nr:Nitrogen permease regulator 2 [Teratosphaeriaceae sp. CCFEE 6253]